MPKREDETYRNIYPHPPSCTCVECTNKRLRRLRKEAHPSYISICPRCGKKSLFYNGRDGIYECLNLRCKASGRTLRELRGRSYGYMTPEETNRAATWAAETQRKALYKKDTPITYETKPTRNRRSKKRWLTPVLIFSILLILFGVYRWWNTSSVVSPPAVEIPPIQETIPPTLPPVTPAPPAPQTQVNYTNEDVEELVYSLINNERENSGLSSLKKDPLLVSLAKEHSTSMVENGFFSHERAAGERNFEYGLLPGSTRGENISKTPRREWVPGPYLTLQEVCEWIISGWMSSAGHSENILNPTFTVTGIGVSHLEEYLYITQMFEGECQEIIPSKGEHIYIGGAYIVGADGHMLTLVNNPDATNPTWKQLKTFLAQDDTSEHPYDFEQFVCADFAEQLHNRAEEAGIKAGFVSITLPNYNPPTGYAAGHALNVFRLVETDKNCYIDSTNNLIGFSWGDSTAFIEPGEPYEAAPVAFVDLVQENGEWYWFGFGIHGLAVNDAIIGKIDIQW